MKRETSESAGRRTTAPGGSGAAPREDGGADRRPAHDDALAPAATNRGDDAHANRSGHDHGLTHSHDHSHGHGHAHGCAADHHRGEYTPEQQADLERVLAFNHRLADAVEDCLDIGPTVESLDPDPLRYMWVDEGSGRIQEQLFRAGALLDQAVALEGHTRTRTARVAGSVHASRPSVATGPGGSRLVAWLEWVEGRGDRLVVSYRSSADADPVVTTIVTDPVDLFRPTAAVDGAGRPWVFFGRNDSGVVGVWGSHGPTGGDVTADTGVTSSWSEPARVDATEAPAFNQEVARLADGRLELVWQGRVGDRFAVFSAVLDGGRWGPTRQVSEGVDNVWDPTVTATPDGSAYAWAAYRDGRYVVETRRRRGDRLEAVRDVTGGTDYALHPSLACTSDGRLWCAFDVVTVVGHGSSGPTRLLPNPGPDGRAAGRGEPDGMRAPGDSVPPELLPEVSARVEVVHVGEADEPLTTPPGRIGPGLDVVPSAMPKLAATPDGGLVLGYRVHRRLPLMTYYWEAAAQVLGPDGWCAPTTLSGTDATLEEVALAPHDRGAVLLTQGDGRLERALHWTEGFGGRECPYLADHHGDVVWHGLHGAGAVVEALVTSLGPAAPADAPGAVSAPRIDSAVRREARRWAGGEGAPRRYEVTAPGVDGAERTYRLYWGDLHRHSLVSRCTSGDEPSLEDFYRYAWDVCEYDFWAVTDHAENSTAYQWWSIQKIADLLHVPGRFVPLYGFEWTSADTGHQNVIYGDVGRGAPIFSAFAEGTTTPAGLWAGLEAAGLHDVVTIPHHPGSAMVNNDWDYHHPRYSRLAEIFQACRGNYESRSCFRQYSDGTAVGTFALDGLTRGHRFGFIASSDHGHGASYVGALATSLSRADVFDALRSRRTFAATTRDVVVDLRLGPHLMGEEVTWTGPRPLRVHAEGYTDVARVEIVRDGRVVHRVGGDDAGGTPLEPGWLRVDLRVEWGRCERTRDWDGRLEIAGGRLVEPAFVGPEVTRHGPDRIDWEHTTHSFGEPYGAQRGGVEASLVGPPQARVRVVVPPWDAQLTLGEIHDGLATGSLPLTPPGGPATGRVVVPEDPTELGALELVGATGALTSCGSRVVDVEFVDDHLDPAFYYARVVLVDGEAAWSSPIWVG